MIGDSTNKRRREDGDDGNEDKRTLESRGATKRPATAQVGTGEEKVEERKVEERKVEEEKVEERKEGVEREFGHPAAYPVDLLVWQTAMAITSTIGMPREIARLVAQYGHAHPAGGLIFTDGQSGLLGTHTQRALELLGTHLQCAHVPPPAASRPHPGYPQRQAKASAEIRARIQQLRVPAPKTASGADLLLRLEAYARQQPPQHACGELTLVYDSGRDGASVNDWRRGCGSHTHTLTVLRTRLLVRKRFVRTPVGALRPRDQAELRALFDDVEAQNRVRMENVDIVVFRALDWANRAGDAKHEIRLGADRPLEEWTRKARLRDEDMSFILALRRGMEPLECAVHDPRVDAHGQYVAVAGQGPGMGAALRTLSEREGDSGSALRYASVTLDAGEFAGVDCSSSEFGIVPGAANEFMAEIEHVQVFTFFDDYWMRGNVSGPGLARSVGRPRPTLARLLFAEMRMWEWRAELAAPLRCCFESMPDGLQGEAALVHARERGRSIFGAECFQPEMQGQRMRLAVHTCALGLDLRHLDARNV